MTYLESQHMNNQEQRVFDHELISNDENDNNRNKMSQTIIFSLIVAMFRDLKKWRGESIDEGELGWRNKYNIHKLSGVSQKQIYKEYGIIEQLIEKGVIEKRPSQSKWGKQKHQYRLNFDHMVNVDKIILSSLYTH